MKASTIKSIFWSLLVGSIGGLALISIAIALERFPPILTNYLMLFCLASSVLISSFILRKVYARESFHTNGSWQFHVSDLILISLGAGAFLILFGLIWPLIRLTVGLPLTLITAIMVIFGLLLGARKGLKTSKYRFLYGIGWTLTIYGLLGVGPLLILLFFGGIANGFIHLFDNILAVLDVWAEDPYWMLYIFRAGLLCLPMGVLFLYFSKPQLETRKSKFEERAEKF